MKTARLGVDRPPTWTDDGYMESNTTSTAIQPAKEANDVNVTAEVLKGIIEGSAHINDRLLTGLELTGNLIAAGIVAAHLETVRI